MRNIQTRILALLLAALMLLGLTACGEEIAGLTENVFSEPGITETAVSEEIPDEPETPEAPEAEADTGTSDSAVTDRHGRPIEPRRKAAGLFERRPLFLHRGSL